MSDPTPTATVVRDFLVPDLGEGLESATIVEWAVQVGATVELNQTLCTVETAKAEVDVPSPFAGTVVELGGADGDTLVVGTLLARLEVATTGAADRPPAPVGAVERQPTLVGYGLDESIDRSRRARPEANGATAVTGAARARAKPPVRKLARSLGVDLASLAPGSGAGGIVTRRDVEHAAAGASATPPSSGGPGYTVEPVRGIRATIAARMAESVATIPTATCALTVDATELLAARATINAALEGRGAEPVVTPFSFLCHLLVRALAAESALNASFVEGTTATDAAEIRVFDDVHLGVATATPRGLLVPVVRRAQALGLVELSAEMARLAAAGRDGTLTPGELHGSTFTVSNFGALGLDEGTPIINPPEAAILGVGAIRRRPHVVDDEVVPRSTAHLTLSFDHRVGDGAEAGRLMNALRELIETPILAVAFA